MQLYIKMVPSVRRRHLVVLLLAIGLSSSARAMVGNAADDSIKRFLAQDDTQPAYRALRRLEAENGTRKGWIEVVTEYSPAAGFTYAITAEGGSSYIRSKVLKAILDGEREVIAQGETARSSLDLVNYSFQANGIDDSGFANVLLSPRRKERVLIKGMMALNVADGALVRLQGRLAKNPSFWLKNVDIVRIYERIGGTVVPVDLETKAQVRFLGNATLHMTYVYTEIDGRQL